MKRVSETREKTRETTTYEDELYGKIWEAFLSKTPTFHNWGKEGKATKSLCRSFRERSPDDPEGMARQFVTAYYRLTKGELVNGSSTFWVGQPFVPSGLNASGIFERVAKIVEQQSPADSIERRLARAYASR